MATDLQSKEHGDILNVIDELRSLGISHHIDLPQVIVCGDQSSGKSSVLEALSGLTFPRKDNLCTRFAIEVVLRRGASENVDLSVVAAPEHQPSGTVDGVGFQRTGVSLKDMESLILEAARVIGIDGSSKNFSNDILRFEVTGPTQPQLTLVDLPGLFQAGNKAQSDDDAKAVTELVLSYMRKTRSIILAIVSAKNDFANQIVTKYARELDPRGKRTLGVITKPDALHVGSESEMAFLDLAENKDVHFHHGWHVLKNRDYHTRTASTSERDQSEADFFAKGIWTNLSRSQVGVSSLRPRLSLLLRNQILQELPSLIEDVELGIKACDNVMAKLGAPRHTLQEQRLHLLHASQSFSVLMKCAVDGSYNNTFFENAVSSRGSAKRLRAVVQNILIAFSGTMRQQGHAQHIVQEVSKRQRKIDPRLISRNEKIDEVLVLMQRSRGRELPGIFNPQLVGDLFLAQSAPWEKLVRDCIDFIWDAIKATLDLIIEKSTDQCTIVGLQRQIIDPILDRIRREGDNMLVTILRTHQKGHPITYNHYLTDNIQKLKETRDRETLTRKLDRFFGSDIKSGKTRCEDRTFDVGLLLNALGQTNTADMDRYACQEALDCMRAYYKVAMKSFVDDFSILVVENCLLQPLPALLAPETVVSLDDNTVQSIAAEPEDMIQERYYTEIKLRALKQALSLLNSLRASKQRDIAERRSTDADSILQPPTIADGTSSQEVLLEEADETDDTPGLAAEPMLNANSGTSDELPVVAETRSAKEPPVFVNWCWQTEPNTTPKSKKKIKR